MATETGPDLSGAAAAVELLMDDTCTASTVTDPRAWVKDPETLRLSPPPGDSTVYDGKCKFKPLGNSAPGAEGGAQLVLGQYKLDLPLSAPELLEGQTVLIGSSRRMPSAAGTIFHVKEPILKTMAVQASYVVERRRRVE